jgi:phage protein D
MTGLMQNPYYSPDFGVSIDGRDAPAALRLAMSSVTFTTGLEGADRVEVVIANQALQWLDQPVLALNNSFTLAVGYRPGALIQVFAGEITGVGASFPSSGVPQITITAQDRRNRMQQAPQAKWHSNPKPNYGNLPQDDKQVTQTVADQYGLQVSTDPVGAKLAEVIATATAGLATDPDSAQKAIQRQVSESDYEFLRRLARQSGLEMIVDHSDPNGGRKLRFFSPLDHLEADLELEYNLSLLDFTPRESSVGQVAAVTANVWVPAAKKQYGITLSAGAGDAALTLAVTPRPAPPDDPKDAVVLDEPLTLATAPRRLVGELMPRLNAKLTGSGSTIGDPRIRAGTVLKLKGLGIRFGGLYRVTSATHTLDTGGYRTRFEVRKEIWFDGVPKAAQDAVRVGAPVKLNIQV